MQSVRYIMCANTLFPLYTISILCNVQMDSAKKIVLINMVPRNDTSKKQETVKEGMRRCGLT